MLKRDKLINLIMRINVLIWALFVNALKLENFEITVDTPQILSDHFKSGLPFKEVMPGKIKEKYSKKILVKTLNNNKTGCKKYKEDYHDAKDQEIGILLLDSDNCSLSTKIHFAQLAGAQVLFLKYVDDKIEEAEVDHSSFEGVRIPIFLLKASNAEYIYDVLQSNGKMSQLVINLSHLNEFDKSINEIDIFMNSMPNNNPMISFLKDLKEHNRIIRDYQINIRFSLGFCKSCKEKKFLRKEPSCLSGGRYCVINSEFRTYEPVMETLRLICIRKTGGNEKLIDYMLLMRQQFYTSQSQGGFNEKDFALYSYDLVKSLGMNVETVRSCVDGSFVQKNKEDKIEFELDDNTLLQEEQVEFLKITKLNTYPLIMVNKVAYGGSINFRDFIKFGCENHLFDCRGFRTFKKMFLIVLASLSLCFVVIIALFCRRVLKKKYDNEMNIKIDEAIQKYLTVDKV